MKNNILTIILLVSFFGLSAQQPKTKIAGRLDTKTNSIHLTNTEGLNLTIPVNKSQQFTYNCTNLTKGFYYLDEIGTVYLAPSYQLQIIPNKQSDYTFSGKGALENNNFRAAKKALEQFFPKSGGESMGELNQATYYLDVPIFEQKLDSFQQHGIALINKSLDSFFQKYAVLDFKFYCRSLISEYASFYGTDLQLLRTVGDSIRKLNSRTPDYVMKITALMASTHKKQLNSADRMRLYELSSGKFDMDDDILFRNSRKYREAFEDYFQSVSFSKYITADEYKGKVTDRNIKRLIVARGEIKNPFILDYFEYTYTKGIVNDHKDIDTVNKYYNEYIAKAKNEAYISDIRKIYDNKIAFSDNHAAPSFKYKDVTGKVVSLESLKGKYVYIDVWATWCGPCKGEIPHLKKLEEAYRGKNLQFVSISVDAQTDFKKWQTFVKTEQLAGIQLITDNAFETPFITKMGINAIPRFILIDPQGKLIYANALRPSDKALREQLNKLTL